MTPDDIDDFDDYIEATRETAPDQSPFRDIVQGTWGLDAEQHELHRAMSDEERRSEIGDLFWYFARVVSGIRARYDVDPLNHEQTDQPRLSIAHQMLCDALEGHEFQRKIGAHKVARAAGRVVGCLRMKVDEPVEIMRANIDKLTDRYPDGFEAGGGQREEEK